MTAEIALRPAQVVVAGLGNEYRRDDGAGAVVAARVAAMDGSVRDIGPVVDPLDLLGRWDDVDLAVVVDAVRSEDPPGTVRVTSLPTASRQPDRGRPSRRHAVSSHGVHVADVLRIARAVGSAPCRVVVVAVVGEDFGRGPGLTAAVEAAIETAAEAVLELARRASPCA